MIESAFLLGALAVLAAPGPTNTLLALAAARHGPRRALPLLGGAIGAYAAMLLGFALAGERLFAAWPGSAALMKVAAAAWLGLLSVRLWRSGAAADAGPVNARQVLAATLLNPKGPVIALVLLPRADDATFPAALAGVLLCVALAGGGWIAGGALAGRGIGTRALCRLAAGWLTLVATGLLASLWPTTAAALSG